MSTLRIESDVVHNEKAPAELYAKLNELANFKQAMPDSVEKFESDADSFLFQLKGMPEVRLLIDERKEPEYLRLKAASSKLDFSLSCHLKAANGGTDVQFVFEGEFNMMMKMMIEKPLTNFINTLAQKVQSF